MYKGESAECVGSLAVGDNRGDRDTGRERKGLERKINTVLDKLSFMTSKWRSSISTWELKTKI